MALLALSRGQLMVDIYKMYKEANMTDLYSKKFLKYSIEELASEYIKIETILESKQKEEFKRVFMKDSYNISSSDSSSDDNFMKNAMMKNPNRLKYESEEDDWEYIP